jgi:hypothetical protein
MKFFQAQAGDAIFVCGGWTCRDPGPAAAIPGRMWFAKYDAGFGRLDAAQSRAGIIAATSQGASAASPSIAVPADWFHLAGDDDGDARRNPVRTAAVASLDLGVNESPRVQANHRKTKCNADRKTSVE